MVALSTGVALPAYQYGSFTGTDLTAYANTGFNLNGEISYFYSHYFGITFMANYNLNGINTNKLEQSYMNDTSSITNVNVNTSSCHDFAGLGGIVLNVPIEERVSMYFRMMMGLRNFYKPSATTKITDNTGVSTIVETSASDLLMALYFSAGGKVMLTESFNLHVNASYIGSTFELNYKSNSTEVNQDAHIGVLAINVGVSYIF